MLGGGCANFSTPRILTFCAHANLVYEIDALNTRSAKHRAFRVYDPSERARGVANSPRPTCSHIDRFWSFSIDLDEIVLSQSSKIAWSSPTEIWQALPARTLLIYLLPRQVRSSVRLEAWADFDSRNPRISCRPIMLHSMVLLWYRSNGSSNELQAYLKIHQYHLHLSLPYLHRRSTSEHALTVMLWSQPQQVLDRRSGEFMCQRSLWTPKTNWGLSYDMDQGTMCRMRYRVFDTGSWLMD